MTPRYLLAPPRRPARHRRAGAIALLIGLLAGATGMAGPTRAEGAASADSTTPDTLSAPPGGASVPLAAAGATTFETHGRFDGALRADRLSHLTLALAIGVGVGLSGREPAAGAGVAITLAVGKELLDDRFDRGDLTAGAVGAGLAWLIVTALAR